MLMYVFVSAHFFFGYAPELQGQNPGGGVYRDTYEIVNVHVRFCKCSFLFFDTGARNARTKSGGGVIQRHVRNRECSCIFL